MNYLVRMRVGTHVTAALIAEVPVPRPADGGPEVRAIAGLARALARRFQPRLFARLNAEVARLYRLTELQFGRVLATFPLVPQDERQQAAQAFAEIP